MSRSGLQAAQELSARYAAVANSLTQEEMQRDSACEGWTVKDLVAHAGSNYQAVVEPPAPSDPPSDSPPMLAEEVMSMLVDARRGWTAQQVLDELNSFEPGWSAALEALQNEPTASVEVPMSELGTYPLHSLADAFAFDIACHLYVDLLGPTGPVIRDLPPLDHATLAPGIGWMLTGLPQMCPNVSTVLDRPVGLVLTGAGGGEWTLRPGAPLLTVENGVAQNAAGVVRSDAFEFMQWGTVRKPWRGHVEISGDSDYVTRVLDAVNVI